jgi:hypothetical protein
MRARPVFLSYANPHTADQQEFVDRVRSSLRSRGLMPRTLGVPEHYPDAPLEAIRRLMVTSEGLLGIAFRRTHVVQGTGNHRDRTGARRADQLSDQWLTSPWVQIESAMAYQIGLPVLLIRETGVLAEGLLEPGVLPGDVPSFTPDGGSDAYLESAEWHALLPDWEERLGRRP